MADPAANPMAEANRFAIVCFSFPASMRSARLPCAVDAGAVRECAAAPPQNMIADARMGFEYEKQRSHPGSASDGGQRILTTSRC